MAINNPHSQVVPSGLGGLWTINPCLPMVYPLRIHIHVYINGIFHVCVTCVHAPFILERGLGTNLRFIILSLVIEHHMSWQFRNSLGAYPDMDSLPLPRPLTFLGSRFGWWYTPLLMVA